MSSQQEVAVPSTQSDTPISLVRRFYGCQTKSVVSEVNFEWTIDRFAYFSQGNYWEPFKSTEFDGKFSLSLGVDQRNVNICLHSSVKLDYPIRVEIAMINEKGDKVLDTKRLCERNSAFPVNVCCAAKSNFNSENFVIGEITISCKIESLDRKPPTEKDTYLEETMSDVILRQLEDMLEKMELSDVTFNIQGRTFPAHKTVLAMRSPVFAAMFQHPTKEAKSNQVEVEDIDPDVFQEVLAFIYGRTSSTAMKEMAPALFAVADKYLLDDLKKRCEIYLIRQLSTVNCLELLSLAVHHSAKNLKTYAMEYFHRFTGDVMKTNHWKKMKKENPAELCDLLEMIFSTAPDV